MNSLLIVDDDPDLRRLLEGFFRAAGWTVRTAPDGKSGLAAASAAPPDVVLLDANLPDADGFALCPEFKRDPAVAVVLMSGERRAPSAVAEGLGAAGADAYVVKPVSLPVLGAKLAALMRTRPQGGRPRPQEGHPRPQGGHPRPDRGGPGGIP